MMSRLGWIMWAVALAIVAANVGIAAYVVAHQQAQRTR
jgi:hypothetical protein